MNFTVIDWIFGIVILIFALSGLVKGFVDCLFNKLCWILGLISACIFYDEAAKYIFQSITNTSLSNILGFIIVFILVFLVVKLVQVIISKIFQLQILKSLDRVLGFAFGIIEGVVVVSLIIFILIKQPFFSAERLLDGSFFNSIVERLFFATKELGTNV